MEVKRIISAALAISFLIILLWVGGWLFNMSLLLISLAALRELYHAFSKIGFSPLRAAGFIAVTVFFIQHFLFKGIYDFIYIFIVIILLLTVQLFRRSYKVNDIAITILGFFYPGILLVFASYMREHAYVFPNYLLILTLVATYSTDTYAYFIGRALGKHKLCPTISPNKTKEGSIGGLAGSVVTVVMLGIVLNWVYNIKVDIIHFVAIGILGGFFSQFGDLSASSIKRQCNIKDFGNVLPGHGGILDRIDSLLFVLPVIYTYTQLFI
ncbi:MAG: phosphatidate cytidylyltransferase [Caldicoprobacterales bacterium]|jgi:phosphatidate cytidylyltransferase